VGAEPSGGGAPAARVRASGSSRGAGDGNDLILVTGATGYVGGRLVPRLLAAGHRVRVLVRDPPRLQGRGWQGSVDVAVGDVLDPGGLETALAGVGVAYYLVHSMARGGGHRERDIAAARGFARAAAAAGDLRVGDALDFWRVEAVEPGRLLRLRAEMRVPGAAWLQFEALPREGGTLLVQTAFFAPRGLAGLACWYGLYPVHTRIFSGMIAALAVEAGRPNVRRGAVPPRSA